jgi:hypothetical protein
MSEIIENLVISLSKDQLNTIIFLSNDHYASEQALLQLQRYIKEGIEPVIPSGGFFLDGRLNAAFNSIVKEIKLKEGGKDE